MTSSSTGRDHRTKDPGWFWRAPATLIALATLLIGVASLNLPIVLRSPGDDTRQPPTTAGPSARSSQGAPGSPAVIPSSATSPEPVAAREVLWQGPVTLSVGTGINLKTSPPKGGQQGPYSTFSYSQNGKLGTRVTAAFWEAKADPTFEQCELQIGTAPVGEPQRRFIVPRPGLGICTGLFGGEPGQLAFLRVESASEGQVRGHAVSWRGENG